MIGTKRNRVHISIAESLVVSFEISVTVLVPCDVTHIALFSALRQRAVG